jgi:hypothetical protein
MDKIYKHIGVPFRSCHWKVQAWKGHHDLIKKYGKKQVFFVCELMKQTESFGFKHNNSNGATGFDYGNMPLGRAGEFGCATIAQADCESPPKHAFFPQMSLAEKMMQDIPEA